MTRIGRKRRSAQFVKCKQGNSYTLTQIGVEDVESAANVINSLSHKDAYYYQSDLMPPAVQKVFREIFGKLMEKYKFALGAG